MSGLLDSAVITNSLSISEAKKGTFPEPSS